MILHLRDVLPSWRRLLVLLALVLTRLSLGNDAL